MRACQKEKGREKISRPEIFVWRDGAPSSGTTSRRILVDCAAEVPDFIFLPCVRAVVMLKLFLADPG
jgi:hypothetical protein